MEIGVLWLRLDQAVDQFKRAIQIATAIGGNGIGIGLQVGFKIDTIAVQYRLWTLRPGMEFCFDPAEFFCKLRRGFGVGVRRAVHMVLIGLQTLGGSGMGCVILRLPRLGKGTLARHSGHHVTQPVGRNAGIVKKCQPNLIGNCLVPAHR